MSPALAPALPSPLLPQPLWLAALQGVLLVSIPLSSRPLLLVHAAELFVVLLLLLLLVLVLLLAEVWLRPPPPMLLLIPRGAPSIAPLLLLLLLLLLRPCRAEPPCDCCCAEPPCDCRVCAASNDSTASSNLLSRAEALCTVKRSSCWRTGTLTWQCKACKQKHIF
jgi:hypothetical protein